VIFLDRETETMADYLVIATWPFGMTAVQTAAPLLAAGKPALDAALAGAQAVEDDPKVHSVGYGGIANAVGTVQLDACVMDGQTLSCGAVAGVENVRHVAALARRVMEKTRHILLVGEGARLFAVQQGFPLDTLNTLESVAEWEKLQARRKQASTPVAPPADAHKDHDTVAVLARDQSGSLGGVCTTSGLSLKVPGRVGDSPLIGHGLYVDNTAGAAGATGTGEEIIRIGGSLLIVEAMRAGRTAQEACEQAVHKANSVAVRRGVHPEQVAFLALDTKGRIGAACTEGTNFQYAVARPGKAELLKARVIGVGDR
jgi:isoaspartyl peptidase/L-asparaginase-like protein (Ntn-hydrolase superfamily)